MTADEFRSMALGFPGAFESAHMNHPDFRVEGKIFATLGYPDETSGMVKLTPEQQRSFIGTAPNVFSPCSGAWGQGGATSVHLALLKKNTLRAALEAAYRNVCENLKKKKVRRGR
jgi:predicted DNA-binding protein (MmcQ/YjbR family)